MSEDSQKEEELRKCSLATTEDGDVGSTSAASAAENLGGQEVPVLMEPVYQVDASHSVQDDSNDIKGAEDGGRDEFLDCSDDIQSHHSKERNDSVQDMQSEELNDGTKVHELNLCNELEKTVAEKYNLERDYEEEKGYTKERTQFSLSPTQGTECTTIIT